MFNKNRKNIGRNLNGNVAIEFAVVAPVFVLILMGTAEFNLAMYVNSVLDIGLKEASHQGRLITKDGFATPQYMTNTQLKDIIVAMGGGLVDATKLTIETTNYGSSWSSYSAGAPPLYGGVSGGGAAVGTAGNVVSYTAKYDWAFSTPMIRNFFGSNGTLTLTSNYNVINQ